MKSFCKKETWRGLLPGRPEQIPEWFNFKIQFICFGKCEEEELYWNYSIILFKKTHYYGR